MIDYIKIRELSSLLAENRQIELHDYEDENNITTSR